MSQFFRLFGLFVLIFALNLQATAQQVKGLPDFTELVEKNGVVVVNISTTQRLERRADPWGNAFPFQEGDPRAEFFRKFFQVPPGGMIQEQESHSLGSGFVISSDGYILTNAHVVETADEINVRLNDKREFSAKVIGSDKRTDIALLKIETTGLQAAKIGDPSQLRAGEWVLAIGSPFGFDNSVTAGIVSAKGRALPQENYVPFIQTDVAINPGNSGGPLFNMKGEVVGINSQIYSRSGGYMGVSFAIPMDVAMEVQSQLRSHGKVSRGRMGVAIQDVSKDQADTLGLSKPQGALVMGVEKGGPADKAGLRVGDVVLRFDNKSVATSSDLPRLVGQSRPGTRVPIHVWRDKKSWDFSVLLGDTGDETPVRREKKRSKSR